MRATRRRFRSGRRRWSAVSLVVVGAFAASAGGRAPAATLPQTAVDRTAERVTADRLGRLIDHSLSGLLARQTTWGGFDDPLAGERFNYGAVALGWLAAERAAEGPAGDAQRRVAALTLSAATRVREPGGFQVWIEALALTPPSDGRLDPITAAAVAESLRAYARPAVGLRARRCAGDARCYNNLKLVDAIGALQLARTGLRSSHANSRLADPAATERATREFLATRVPRAQRANLRLHAGSVAVTDAAVLSDPSRNPLAYHALSSALLLRGIRQLNGTAPPTARTAARRALWALVALSDPEGDISWMGRGRQLVWTYAATVYAAVAGAAEFEREDRPLAARLRRLADLAFAELQRRRGDAGLALGPTPRRSLAGLDRSADSIVYSGLALVFLQLAAGEADAATGPVVALPAEVPGGVALDPSAAGVAAIRAQRVWLAVHRAATHPQDARYDVGLLAALVRDGNGRWRPAIGQRPNTAALRRAPSSGPLLLFGGRTLVPAGTLAAGPTSISLTGAWRGGGRRIRARWRFEATSKGVRLRSPCPKDSRLALVEWIPADAPIELGSRTLRTRGRSVTFSARIRARRLRGKWASAAHERLIGVQLETRCTGRPLAVSWQVR